MAERTYDELFEAARLQRLKDIEEGIDPRIDAFVVTDRELTLIRDRPSPCYELSRARDRIFGLSVTLLAPSNEGRNE